MTSPSSYGSLSRFVTCLQESGQDGASGEVESPAGKERQERRKKDCFFDASEASILLKIKVEYSQSAQDELVFGRKLAPKCTQKSRFLAILDYICTLRAPNHRGATRRFESAPIVIHRSLPSPPPRRGVAFMVARRLEYGPRRTAKSGQTQKDVNIDGTNYVKSCRINKSAKKTNCKRTRKTCKKCARNSKSKRKRDQLRGFMKT